MCVEKPRNDWPLISCLCISNNTEEMVKRCIQSFNDQLYENKELIIIYENTSKAYYFISKINQNNIYVYEESSINRKKSLGELRNIAIKKCKGRYVIQWDDDDIYDPRRINNQYGYMMEDGGYACLLDQVTIYNAITQKYSLSKVRQWEGSILFDRNLSIKKNIWYPDLPKGEDTPFIEMIREHYKISTLTDPFLYLYVTHTDNAFEYDHHQSLIKTKFWIFKTYLKLLDKRLGYFITTIRNTNV